MFLRRDPNENRTRIDHVKKRSRSRSFPAGPRLLHPSSGHLACLLRKFQPRVHPKRFVEHPPKTRTAESNAPRLASIKRAINKASADFWLSFFFWHARRQPWFARGTKPFFLYFVWNYSEHLYGGTMANAARILGPASTFAEREALARIIGNFYDFVCDVGLCLGQTRRQMVERVDRVEGRERFDAIRTTGHTAGKGVIVATAHMGSFEIGAAALMEREKRLHVLFRRDALDLFEQIRSTLRKTIGVIEVPVDEGWTVWMRLRDALARDEVVLIQGDRVMPGQKGQPVKFFDGHILMPTGPVRLAMVTGSPIIPVFSVHAGRENPAVYRGGDPGGRHARRRIARRSDEQAGGAAGKIRPQIPRPMAGKPPRLDRRRGEAADSAADEAEDCGMEEPGEERRRRDVRPGVLIRVAGTKVTVILRYSRRILGPLAHR